MSARNIFARPARLAAIAPYVWMVLFGLVGGQMAWVLRPFVGSPDVPFTWFRPRELSFFDGVLRALRALFGGP